MRVASIDMRNANSMCPSGLRRIVEGSHTLCARNREELGCSSAVFSIEGVQYKWQDNWLPEKEPRCLSPFHQWSNNS